MRIENSFIPVRGVGEQTEQQLWTAGVTDWDAFDPDVPVVGQTRARRIEEYIAQARSCLAAREVEFFARTVPRQAHWRLYGTLPEETTFLDIETTGLAPHSAVVTTVSLHRDGDTTTLVRGRDLTARRLRQVFANTGLLVTFNGRRFDVPFLEKQYDLSVSVPHADLYLLAGRLGYSGGLTDLESVFDIERERPDISGRDAVRLWREYERGDDQALDTLVEYNRTDTRNMVPLFDSLAAELDRTVVPDDAPVGRTTEGF